MGASHYRDTKAFDIFRTISYMSHHARQHKKTQGGPPRNPFSVRRYKISQKSMNTCGKIIKECTEEGIMNSNWNERMREVFSKEMNRILPYRKVRRWQGTWGRNFLKLQPLMSSSSLDPCSRK